MNTMNEWIGLLLPLAAGALLGVVFFGGLWLTVRKGLSSEKPTLWFFGSLLVRTGIVVAGFYWVAGSHFWSLMACFAGFMVSRVVLLRLAGPMRTRLPFTKSEGYD